MLDAAKNLQQAAESNTTTNDPRMQGLAALNTAMSAKRAYDTVQDVAQNGIGFKVSLSLGNTQSHSESSQSGQNVVSSGLAAGRDVNIRATGAGQDSNINVVGSSIEAGNNVNLKADGDINLLSAQNTARQDGSNGNSGWSVGIGFTVGGTQNGFTLDLAANKGQGKSEGDDVTQTNTSIKAGNQATLISGRDTNLKGAVVTANQVQANVGRDLNIESLQDTSKYKSKQTDASVGISICIPPFCYGIPGSDAITASGSAGFNHQKMQSDYASVTEQSGIKAGDGGFQIEVKGNTGLTGGVIASNDKAVEQNLNSLSTGTLTWTDIKNKAEYDANSIGLSGGAGAVIARGSDNTLQAGAPGRKAADIEGVSANAPIALVASGDARSTTRSGISGANVTITSEAGQQALTGQTAAATIADINTDVSSERDGSNKLKPIFDAEEIQNNFAITSTFIQNTGIYLEERAREVDAKNKQADEELEALKNPTLSDKERETHIANYNSLKEQARQIDNDWGSGGTYRQITVALTAGASANVTGGTSQFAQNMLVNYVQQEGSSAIGKMVEKGLKEGSPEHAAWHAMLGCAGAAASRQSCSAGAMGGAASSFLTTFFSETSADESNASREAKRNVIASLVTGIAAMTDPSAAATSTNAAIANVDNNWLATQQVIQYKKEYNEAKTPQEKVAVFLKWEKTSLDQDVLTGVGIAKGFKDGMAGIGVDTLNSAVSMLRDPQAHIDAVIAFVDSPEVRDRLKQHIHAQLREKLEKIDQALEHGGDENAEMLGKMMGEVTAVVISTVSTGGGGAATKSATLSEMGILISGKKLEQLATTVKLEKVTENFAQAGKPGRDPDVPFIETVTTAGKTVDQIEIPSWYKEDSSAGAMLARPANLPEGSRVFVNTKTGNVEVLIPEKGLHVVRGEGGLEVKDGGRLANLKAAEANIAEAQKTNSSVGSVGAKEAGTSLERGLAYDNPSNLVQNRVSEIQSQIPANSQGRITMGVAVVEDANGVRSVLVSTSEPRGYLRPGVSLQEGEKVVVGTGHAEADIVSYANANGLKVVDIGATRPVCASCQNVIEPTGANVSTPLKPQPKAKQ
nr:hemagglutinin repeat-containing protein [Pseudomonas sp. 21LCFQ010]